MSAGIVICSRTNSERLPNKPMLKLNDKPIIQHLVEQLIPVDIPIIVAVPTSQASKYDFLKTLKNVYVLASDHELDPLARTDEAARHFNLDYIIRITHDKIFIDTDHIYPALAEFKRSEADYLFTTNCIPGTNFEIISRQLLHECAFMYKNVEHISYPIRMHAKQKIAYRLDHSRLELNLLIDQPEDYKLMQVLFSVIPNEISFTKVYRYIKHNPKLIGVNSYPLVTIYTCAYNAEKWLRETMESVYKQHVFPNCEYILIDDKSTDRTLELIAKFAVGKSNVFWHSNDKNIGLASSSNYALKKARGKYLIRIDADDFFINESSVSDLMFKIEQSKAEVVYPDNFFGSSEIIQKGSEHHHVGGAIFEKRALNYLKFTDGLRNYEGLDLFERAKNKLKIDYLSSPVFYYRQHNGSMSKTNLKDREVIKKKIYSGTLHA